MSRIAPAHGVAAAMLSAALLVLGWIAGGLVWGGSVSPPVTVRVVQPNVPQAVKFHPDSMRKMVEHTFDSAQNSPALLTVFPETVLPFPWQDLSARQWLPLVQTLQRDKRAVLLGSVSSVGAGYANSAIWLEWQSVSPTGQMAVQQYDKRHLLPFGETVPTGFAWLLQQMNIPLGGFALGQNRSTFTLPASDVFAGADRHPPIRIATNICYENVFGEELTDWHAAPTTAPHIWINLTNLAWFGDARTSPAHRQFIAMSRARALELARPMLVVTNTGVSAHITSDGLLQAQLPAQVSTYADWQVFPSQGVTPFSQWANRPLWWGLAFLVLLGIVQLSKRGRSLVRLLARR